MAVKLFPHQAELIEKTKNQNNVGYFVEMGLGKTFISSEKTVDLGSTNTLVVCQFSKIEDWIEHFEDHYPQFVVFDLTHPKQLAAYLTEELPKVGVINYELLFRRSQITDQHTETLILDESSLIQNETAKRSKAVLDMPKTNTILLSGTVVNGRYECLWSQCNLLGWKIGKKTFWNHYVVQETFEDQFGSKQKRITGYKNIDRLKRKLAAYGAHFMRTEGVYDMPEMLPPTIIRVAPSKEYKKFAKDSVIKMDDETVLVGDMQLTKRLYLKMLAAEYSKEKLAAFKELIDSTSDRLIVFYNRDEELERMTEIVTALEKPISVVNGKKRDLVAYKNETNSITFVQYQAGAKGLNLQLANKTVYFSLPDGDSENFEQSKKRTHRIGQDKPCFYYVLLVKDSVEEDIQINLGIKKSRIDNLFGDSK